MRVLVTNDDGIAAPGLRVLAAHLDELGHDVTVVAPSLDRSGSGAGLGPLHDGAAVPLRRFVLNGLDHLAAHALDAPPGLCALAACAGLFGPRPDVVISGVNAGWNTGRGVLHSGTFGAALTAVSAGVPAVAVSCGPLPTSRFDTAAWVIGRLLSSRLGVPAGLALNVNVPDVDVGQLNGTMEGSLARTGLHSVRLLVDAQQLTVSERVRSSGMQPGTDGDLVLRGFVSVTALQAALTPVPVPSLTAALNGLLSPERTLEDA